MCEKYHNLRKLAQPSPNRPVGRFNGAANAALSSGWLPFYPEGSAVRQLSKVSNMTASLSEVTLGSISNLKSIYWQSIIALG